MAFLDKSESHVADASGALPNKRRRCSKETALDNVLTMHQESNPKTSMTMEQLSDDILIHMVSYLFPPTDVHIKKLFKNLGKVSKFYQSFCHQFVRRVPINVNIFAGEPFNPELYTKIAWLCKNRVKLAQLKLKRPSFDLQVSCFVYILECCDISSLYFLDIEFLKPEQSPRGIFLFKQSHDSHRSDAEHYGIPQEVARRESCWSIVDAQILIREVIGNRTHSVSSLHISCSVDSLHIPLLQLFRNSLQSLSIFSGFFRYDEKFLYPQNSVGEVEGELNEMAHTERCVGQSLDELISTMPNLNTLSIFGHRGRKIHSDSLETLSLTHSLKVKEIVCPALQNLCVGVHGFGRWVKNWLKKYPLETKKLHLIHEDFGSGSGEVQRHISQMMERMTSLEHLIIEDIKFPLVIKSKTLKKLDVSGCNENFEVRECSCPQLQSFVGNVYTNRAHLRPAAPLEFYKFFRTSAERRVKVGDWRFFGVDIPDSCVLEFRTSMDLILNIQ